MATKIKQLFFYPTLVLIIALGSLLFMLLYIVPHFEVLFLQFNGSLPKITQIVIQLSKALQVYGIEFLWLTLGGISLYYLKSSYFKTKIMKWGLSLPLIRTLYQKIVLARFVHALALCLKSALPLTEALLLAAPLYKISPTTILRLHHTIQSGNHLYQGLQSYPDFPGLMVQMVKTGEESGTLDFMLAKYSQILENEITQSLSMINQLLEPLILVLLGVLIGGILVALYLPLFQLGMVFS